MGIIGAGLLYWHLQDGKSDHGSQTNAPMISKKQNKASSANNVSEGFSGEQASASAAPKRHPAQEVRSGGQKKADFQENAPENPAASYKEKYQKQKYQQNPRERLLSDFKDASGNQYLLLDDYHAIRRSHENQNDFPQAILKNGYFIVQEPPGPGERTRVLKNASTGGLAVFTGVLKTRLKDMNFADELASNFQCQVANRYDHINAVFYQFESYEETLAAHRAFQEHPWVISSEIELLEGERGPR